LSLHGIEGAFSDSGPKTVIPASVIGKFSLRIVPDQRPKCIAQLVTAHLEKEFAKVSSYCSSRLVHEWHLSLSYLCPISLQLGSPNKLTVEMILGGKPWLSDPKHPNFEAAARAIETVHGQTPDYTREGGSIPITSALEDATGMNVLLLPAGACDDMAHSQNEKYNISNLVNAIKVCCCDMMCQM